MGTFGTGPFDSDGAQDLPHQLAGQHPDRRHGIIDQLLADVLRQPD